MGHFVDGEWITGWYAADTKGHFIRPATTFRDKMEAIEPGRYHLYVSLACPWAHRTLIARSILGLQDKISVTVVDWLLGDDGWAINPERPGCNEDPIHHASFLREVYKKADGNYTGRVTVPVLWDKREGRIVNNESREILRQLITRAPGIIALNPKADEVMDAIYNPVNNGVYRCGFASSQEAYDEAAVELYKALDHWEEVLGKQAFLCGAELCEADICMFTTLLRFDPVYSVHFKCSKKRIMDYPNLSRYLRAIYQTPGVAETCNLDHIRNHYYQSHRHINPTGIVAVIPDYDLNAKS